MEAELTKKETRTVYDKKVVRIQLDVPFGEIEGVEGDCQDLLKWLDNNVDSDVGFSIGPFDDEEQETLDSSTGGDDNKEQDDGGGWGKRIKRSSRSGMSDDPMFDQ